MLAASVLAAFGFFCFSLAIDMKHEFFYVPAAIFVIGMLPGCAAALVGFSERLARKAQARHYDRMRALYERAYAVLPEQFATITPGRARAVYAVLGREAMKEHAEWVSIFRQRPISLPQG